jgi:CheY-like chemotaxis protein
MRQKTHGGRLGSHLLYYKFATEQQMLQALEQQLGFPGVALSGREVPPDVLGRVPLNLMEGKSLFPFRFDPATRTLHLAMVDPRDEEAILLARQAFGAREAKPYVAVESSIRNAINVYYHGRAWDDPLDQIVEMPDLFGEEPEPVLPDPRGPRPLPETPELREVALLSRKSFLKTFLVPLFEREGIRLRVLSEPEELDALTTSPVPERILLSGEMDETFQGWVAARGGRTPLSAEVTIFSRVSDSLLEQTVAYPQMFQSLLLVLQQMAEVLSGPSGWAPPYGTLQQEATELARNLGLGRMASDGLRIAVLLLVPARGAPFSGIRPGNGFTTDCFQDVLGSMSRAKAIFFPWEVDVCLRAFLDLLSGNVPEPSEGLRKEDHRLAPQILSVVWCRHLFFPQGKGSETSPPEALKVGLRSLEPRGISPEVVEAYLRLLARQKRVVRAWAQHDVFLIFPPEGGPEGLGPRLRSEGFRVVELKEISEARHLYNRKRPDVIVMDYDAFQDEAASFCREVGQEARTLLFAVTAHTLPSVVLRLLDRGFRDVFSPPFHLDLLLTRIQHAVEAMERQERMTLARKGFTGSFRDLPFVDLIQALSLSQRSVRIDLGRENGERACLYLRNGHLTSALCGETEGEKAVFRVICWGEDGTFRLQAAQEYPPDNITAPTDYVLLEGVRRMEEGAI